ncbi:MAG: hypothetical protein J7641_14645 [Cyanobacteria bacterium SID2]|nr:hypothetical protein [Cyanobacteria bacterium SID2]
MKCEIGLKCLAGIFAISIAVSGCTASGKLADTLQDEARERGFEARSLAVRQQLAAADLTELDEWWRSRQIGDPHKYLLPPMLAQLSLTEPERRQPIWDLWLKLEREAPDLYHFRSLYDVRIFFLFRDEMPDEVRQAYQSMVSSSRVLEWGEGGTENHISQQYLSGLAMMDGSGFTVAAPHLLATNEAWLRAELSKYLTIGQGEFHSSIYSGYTIGALLNLYDFAETPQLRKLAKAALDWLAANAALRLSWGTVGGAESRGFDRATWDSGLSAVAWMWWGTQDREAIDRIITQMSDKHLRLAIPAATSSYRPPEILRSIAEKTVPLPFQLHASHPAYYSYHEDNQFWETFYATADYTLGTLVIPGRSYRREGTINAQYATYKLVVRDLDGIENAVVSLGGTYHTPMATGRSPGDRFLQEKGTVLYQLRLSDRDRRAGVRSRSHLVIPRQYGEPQTSGDWYIWRIENVWLCARPWGDRVVLQNPVSEDRSEAMALVAQGGNTAWITDVASVADYPTFDRLVEALEKNAVVDEAWESQGILSYTNFGGDRLEMTYAPDRPVATARINGVDRALQDRPVLDSPYANQPLNSGTLVVQTPQFGLWELHLPSNGIPDTEMER